MHLVDTAQPAPQPLFDEDFAAAPLVVLFADGEEIDAAREQGSGRLQLAPPCSMSDADSYLVLPDDIGMEIVDIFADGDHDLVQESLRDGLAAVGRISSEQRGLMVLDVEACRTPLAVLEAGLAYGAEVDLACTADPLRALNTLPHAQCTTLSALLDEDGLRHMIARLQYVGTSWRAPASAKLLQHLDPTFVWSRRLDDAWIGIETALFVEEEDLTLLLRPARFRPPLSPATGGTSA